MLVLLDDNRVFRTLFIEKPGLQATEKLVQEVDVLWHLPVRMQKVLADIRI